MRDRTWLYRYFDGAGRLLYVGITKNLEQRARNHEREQLWWHLVAARTLEEFDTREEALYAEAVAIREENPVHNIAGRAGQHGILERLEAIAYWRTVDTSGYRVLAATRTPTMTVKVVMHHAIFGMCEYVVESETIEDAARRGLSWAKRMARGCQRENLAKAERRTTAQVYEWPKRLPWRPGPNAPEDIAA